MHTKKHVSFVTNNRFDPKTGCWNWTASDDGKEGYGKIWYMGRMESVHRVSAHCYMGYNLREKKLRVLHHCDNPKCFNPKHLFLGSDTDNNRDTVSKGRHRNQNGAVSVTFN